MRFAASFFVGSCNIRNALVCIDFINGIDNLQRLARGKYRSGESEKLVETFG